MRWSSRDGGIIIHGVRTICLTSFVFFFFWNSMDSLTLQQGWGNHLEKLERSSFRNKGMHTLVRMFWFDQKWLTAWSLVGKLLERLRKCGIVRWSVSFEMGFEISNAQTINRELSSPSLPPSLPSSPTLLCLLVISTCKLSYDYSTIPLRLPACFSSPGAGTLTICIYLWASKNALFHMLSWSWYFFPTIKKKQRQRAKIIAWPWPKPQCSLISTISHVKILKFSSEWWFETET